jgi:hydroxymethylbilane synthase
MTMPGQSITIGTRGSQLALWQANWVRQALMATVAGLAVDLQVIKTKGDKILDVPLAQVGGKALFVKEIEEAMLRGDVDLAVHSMKDMPADLPEGLKIGAVPRRETPFDVLISRSGATFDRLPEGAVIGTSSLRRGAQLRHARKDVTIAALRGNLDTRLRKLESHHEGLDAIVLAAAGVKRLGLQDRITENLNPAIMLPAVGQGALCIETRLEDARVDAIVNCLDHLPTRTAVTCERAFLRRLEGSCQVPIAALADFRNNIVSITGLVADLDGTAVVRDHHSGPAAEAADIGTLLAERLLARGADLILDKLKHHEPTKY